MKQTENTRGAGILLPISSLPSPYGIGTLGKAAYEFVDMLASAGQKYWQVLPVGPTSFGDSPYQSFSAFAGNPYFIDLDMLVEEGILSKEEILSYRWGKDKTDVDYEAVYNARFKVLKEAFYRSKYLVGNAYKDFEKENEFWLNDYAMYMALKNHFDNKEWLLWDEDVRYRKEEALKFYKTELAEEVSFWKYCQFMFNKQWQKLREYANEKNIKIIGDIPLYVSMDSADVWVHGRLFELDERKQPIHVAGVPPDIFSEDGQRWGNPLYNWDAMEKENFEWWAQRMRANAKLYDVIRIDHFIGIVRYYSIPAECKTAKTGEWIEGPGEKLTSVIKEVVEKENGDIIAEDLGIVVQSVRDLMEKMDWPGMKILEFAFDSDEKNDHLPHNIQSQNSVIYGGTHDNDTMVGFFNSKSRKELQYVFDYLGVRYKSQIPDGMLKLAYASVAKIAIFQMQDILKLDNRARMNLPATVGTNWRWRMSAGQFTKRHCRKLYKLAKTYNRL